jgi:nucleoside-diphosphate-sugar epimerase
MRILITGATGFIGQKLLKRLTDQQHTLAIHSRKQIHLVDSNVLVFSGELNQFKKEIITFLPEYVFHLAGSSIYPKNAEEEIELWSSNVLYGNVLLSIVKEIPSLVFVNFTTSLAYYGTELKPFSFYALTKANFVQSLQYFTHHYNVRVFNLILYTVYGKEDNTKRALNYILDSLDASEPISMSPGEQLMDFIHVDDVIGLCLQLLENKPNEKIEEIHVGTGRGTTLKQSAQIIEFLSKQKTNIEFGSIPYRKEEKMVNIAPIENNRFWKSSIPFEKGIESILLYSNK